MPTAASSRHRVWVLACVTALLTATAAPAVAANDPYFSQQWGMERVGVEAAWQVSRGEGAVIAVVDSGIDLAHDDLATQLLRGNDGEVVGHDFVDDDEVPQDAHGHGTMVAGIAAAATDNGTGVAGTAPRSRIMPVRVLDEEGEGAGDDVDRAVRWAVDHGADVINLSLESETGAETGAGSISAGVGASAPVAAVRYAWENGVIVVAAAGNSGNPFTDYPPGSPVVLVGASDRDDARAGFSDSGRDDVVLAPGVDIVSTWCVTRTAVCDGSVHNYGEADGTSFAAPTVAGVLALLRTAGLDHEAAVARLRQTARDVGPPGRDNETGYGIVDADAATDGLAEPGPTSPTPTETQTSGGGTTSAGGTPSPAATPSADRPAPTTPPPTAGATPTAAPVEPVEPVEPVTPAPTASARSPEAGDDTASDGVRADPATDPSPVAAPDGDGGDDWIRVVATALVGVTAVLWTALGRPRS